MIAAVHRGFGLAVDSLLCGALALLHRRHGRRVSTRGAVEEYLAACERQSRPEHFALPDALEDFREDKTAGVLSWRSRAFSEREFPVNGRAWVRMHRVQRDAPTVVMLHALMSASDTGYRLWARRFNALGWNAAFVHLPFHYSRRPRGHFNGELCWTADLLLTGDTLRQAVVDVRQLLAHLRTEGVREFGLLASSYGGWVASLLASLEPDWRFLALLAPMVNISHASFDGPTSPTIRRQLARAGVERALVERHAHLSSPLLARPLGDAAERTLILAGAFDRIVRFADLAALRDAWPGAELQTVPQAHFGYGMIPRAVEWLRDRQLLP